MTMKTCLWLTSLTLMIGLVSLTAQDSKESAKKSDQATVAEKRKAKAASPKKPARSGHYLPPRERKLDELISKIRIAEEAGKKYEGKRPMTEKERERARERRMKVEGGANFREGISGAESEYALSVDPTGQNIVVGYNLFATDPNGLSGVGRCGLRRRAMLGWPIFGWDSHRRGVRLPKRSSGCWACTGIATRISRSSISTSSFASVTTTFWGTR